MQKLNFVEYQISQVKVLDINNYYLLVGQDKGQLSLIDMRIEQNIYSHQFDNLQNIIGIFWINELQFCVITDQSNVYTFSIQNIQDYIVQKLDTSRVIQAKLDILNIQEQKNNGHKMEEESFNSDLEVEDETQNQNGIYLCVAYETGEVKIYKSDLDKEKTYFSFINTISNMTNRNSQIGSIDIDANNGYVLIGYKNGQIKKNEILNNGNNIWTLDTQQKQIQIIKVFNDQFCVAAQQDGSLLMIQTQYGALVQDIKLDDCQILTIAKHDQHVYVSCSNRRIYHFLFNTAEQQFQQVAKNLTDQMIINDIVIFNQNNKEWMITGGLKQDLVKNNLKDGYLQSKQHKIIFDTLMPKNFTFYCENNILGYHYQNNISLLKIENDQQTVLFRLKHLESHLSISYNDTLSLLACQSKTQLKIYNTLKGKVIKIIEKQYQNILFLRDKLICYDSINNTIEILDSHQNFHCIRKSQVKGFAKSPLQFELSYNKTQILICSQLESKCSLFKISKNETMNLDFLVENKVTKFLSFYQKQDNIFFIQNKIRIYDIFKQQTFSITPKNKLPLIKNLVDVMFSMEDKFKAVFVTKFQTIKIQLKKNGIFDVQNLQDDPILSRYINQNLILFLHINRNNKFRQNMKNSNQQNPSLVQIICIKQ